MNKTLQEQYNLIKEGKGNKQQFFKSARHIFPDLITPVNTFEDTITILKNRGVISEGIGGLVTKGKTPDWHSIFKENIEKLKEKKNEDDEDEDDEKYKEMIKRHEEEQDAKYTLPNIGNLREAKEAKAIEKEPTKDVVDMETKGYDYKDKKNYDNVFGQEFLQGFYTEMSDSKNEGKNVEELRAIVAKNLAKDINHYAKEGQFGLKGVGYTTEAPGLGTPKEAKGKHKSSGYGDLKESVLRSQIHILIKEILSETTADGSSGYSFADSFSEYSNDALTDMILNLSRFKDNEEEIQDLKKELTRRRNKKSSISENEGMMINGKPVDIGSIDIEDIDTRDYPDFSDAYAAYAEFEDGTPLTDSELDELNSSFGDVIHELIFDRQLYLDENKKK